VRSHRYNAEEIYYLFIPVFTFLVPAYPGSPGKRAVKRVCVCVCVIPASFIELLNKSQIITDTCCIYMCLDVLGGDVTS